MSNYREMYFQLAAKVADAVELLESALQKGEALYMQACDQRDLTTQRNEQSAVVEDKKDETIHPVIARL